MSEENKIKKGGLADKMAGFVPEPPESVWQGVSSQLNLDNKRRRTFFILFAAAAGLALAITVGVQFINLDIEQNYVDNTSIQSISESEQLNESRDSDTAEEGSDNESIKQPSPVNRNILADRRSNNKTIDQDRSNLEEKVINALEELQNESPGNKEIIAELIEGETQIAEAVSEDSIIENIPAQKINEDSLLNLLLPELVNDLEPEKVSNNSKWQFGASLSPQISYRDLASTNVAQNIDVNNSESAKLTYSGGVQLSYQASKRLSIESGIFYNKMGVNIGDYSNFRTNNNTDGFEVVSSPRLDNVISISNSMGTVVSSDKALFLNTYSGIENIGDYNELSSEELVVQNSSVNGFSQSFEFLEIPISIKYNIIEKAITVQLIGGMSTNLLMNNSFLASTENGLEKISEVENVRTMNYSGNAGLGFVYGFAKNFSLSIEPRFRYYLNSINSINLPATRPYAFGLMTGVNYTF